jgi:hypothetical protein
MGKVQSNNIKALNFSHPHHNTMGAWDSQIKI